MEHIIYGLADSRNDLIYYVGKSSVGSKRALSHLTRSHSPEVNKWVESVTSDWGNIKVILIEEVEDMYDLEEREKYWIGVYSTANANLLNKKDYPHLINAYTDEDDIKFSEFKHSIYFAGDIIRKRRLALNISQEELGSICSLSRSSISLAERGENVSLSTLKKISLGLTKLSIDKHVKFAPVKKRAS